MIDIRFLFRKIRGTSGKYLVDSCGRIYSVRARKLLKHGIASNGYPTVVLGRTIGTKTVHSIVADTFLGRCPKGFEVCHIDGDRKNPHLSNLRYGSRKDNVFDMLRHGTRVFSKRKLTQNEEDTVVQLSSIGETRSAISKLFGVSTTTVYRTLRRSNARKS